MARQLEGQRVVAFGGSGGIGLATALLCHERGADITLIGRDVEKLEAAVATLARSEWRSADVRNEAAVAQALASLGCIDHVFISVGLGGASNILRGDMASLRRPFEERIFGTFTIVRAAAPKMKESSITLMSGMNASRVRPGASAQTAAALRGGIAGAHSRSRSCSHTRQCGSARLDRYAASGADFWCRKGGSRREHCAAAAGEAHWTRRRGGARRSHAHDQRICKRRGAAHRRRRPSRLTRTVQQAAHR